MAGKDCWLGKQNKTEQNETQSRLARGPSVLLKTVGSDQLIKKSSRLVGRLIIRVEVKEIAGKRESPNYP